MKSSSGQYYIGLDHLRAFAAFMVFTWHFIHVRNAQYAPPPVFPLSLLSEGHTGVALFMTLSGYLFKRLLNGKNIDYVSFTWNRLLRLAPLLILVILFEGLNRYLSGGDIVSYAKRIIAGLVMPALPNGGWSITIEFHFYLLLPLLLCLSRKSKHSLILLLAVAVLARGALYLELEQIRVLSYYTIVGRIDQFLLGMMAYDFRTYFVRKHIRVLSILALFATFYWYFDLEGGFYNGPAQSPIWVYLPTIEGVAYASLISWYDNSFKHSTGRLSRIAALTGTYSYSIYLLHFFVVFWVSNVIDEHLIDLSNIYLAMLSSLFCFFLMVPIGYVSYRFVESPFLKLRTRYIVADPLITNCESP